MGVDDILDGARADLQAEERRWNERFEREKGRRQRLEREVARLRDARDGSPSPSDARRLERENAELRRENDGLRADVAARDSEVARRKDQKRELQAAYRDKLDEAEALGRALEGVTPALYAALENQPTAHVDAALLNADVAEDLNAARGAKTPRGVLLILHGCSHRATDAWPKSDACPECTGLPIETRVVSAALTRNWAVAAVTSHNRRSGCWSQRDVDRIAKATGYVRRITNAGPATVSLGASSGGGAAPRGKKTLATSPRRTALGRARPTGAASATVPPSPLPEF